MPEDILKEFGEDLEKRWEAYCSVRYPDDNEKQEKVRLFAKEAWVAGGLAVLAVMDSTLDELDEGNGSVCIDDILDRAKAYYSQETSKLSTGLAKAGSDQSLKEGQKTA